MNKIFRVIWNYSTHTWVAVSELQPSRGKSKSSTATKATAAAIAVAGALASLDASASVQIGLTSGASVKAQQTVVGSTESIAIGGATITTAAKAGGTNAIAIGRMAEAGTSASSGSGVQDGIAIGNSSKATAKYSVAMGSEACATKDGSIAIGRSANAAGANGNGSIAIGDDADSGGADAAALGNNANSAGEQATALGNGTFAGGNNATAVGNSASANALSTIALGDHSKASEVNATAIGTNALATGVDSTASGSGATATGTSAIATGTSAKSTGTNATATGVSSLALGTDSMAIGTSSIAQGLNSIAQGTDAVATGKSTAIGSNAKAIKADEASKIDTVLTTSSTLLETLKTALASVDEDAQTALADADTDGTLSAFVAELEGKSADDLAYWSSLDTNSAYTQLSKIAGYEAVVAQLAALKTNATFTEIDAIAIGTNATASASQAVAMGSKANASGTNGVAIGYNTVANGSISAIAIGSTTNATAESAVAIGNLANAEGAASIALGLNAKSTNNRTVAIGSGSIATGDRAVAIGENANASAQNAFAMGINSKASGKSSLAAGSNANASGESAVAAGNQASAGIYGTSLGALANNSDRGVALGYGTTAAQFSSAVGYNAKANTTYASAFGTLANASGARSIAIGYNAQATTAKSVALGDSATTRSAVATTQGTVNGVTYGNFCGTSPVGVVSVGSDSEKRQIVNVAAGQVSSTSTDAINGSQLYSVMANSQWTAKQGTRVETNNDTSGIANSSIHSGNSVTFVAGKNIVLEKVNDGNSTTFTYATKDNVSFATSVQIGDKILKNSGNSLTIEGATTSKDFITGLESPTYYYGSENGQRIASSSDPDLSIKYLNKINDVAAGDSGDGALLKFNSSTAAADPTAAVTVADLQKMGWIVTASENIDGTGVVNPYAATVKNAGIVDFVGGEGIQVNGTTTSDGIRRITITADKSSSDYGSITLNTTTNAAGTAINTGSVGYADGNGSKAATVATVANAINNSGWNIYQSDFDAANKKGIVKPSNNVSFANGTNTAATVTPDTSGTGYTVKYDAVATGSLTSTSGAIDTPTNGTALMNATAVANAINNSGFTTKRVDGITDASQWTVNSGDDVESASTTITPGRALDFGAGYGLVLKRETSNSGDVTYRYGLNVTQVSEELANANVSVVVTNITLTDSPTVTDDNDGVKNGIVAVGKGEDEQKGITAGSVAKAINQAGWKLQNNNANISKTSEFDLINAGDLISFNNGKGTTTTVKANGTTGYDVTVDVATGDTSVTTAAEVAAGTATQVGVAKVPTGTSGDALMNVSSVATLVNSVSSTSTIGRNNGEFSDQYGKTDAAIKAGTTQTFKAGNGLVIAQDYNASANTNNITYAVDLPIAYNVTNANGDKLLQANDGNYYLSSDVDKATGEAVAGATPVTSVIKNADLVNGGSAYTPKGSDSATTLKGDGGVALNNVAWATNPDQAVNLDQLNATVSWTESVLGGGATYDPATGKSTGFTQALNSTAASKDTADVNSTNVTPATTVAQAITNLNNYVNAGWKVGDANGTVVERISPNEQVNFVNSSTVVSKVEASNGGANVSFEIVTGSLSSNANGSTTGATAGVADVASVQNAINNSGWQITGSDGAAPTATDGTASDGLVNPSDKVSFVNGTGTVASVVAAKDEAGNTVGYNVTFNVDTGTSSVSAGKAVATDAAAAQTELDAAIAELDNASDSDAIAAAQAKVDAARAKLANANNKVATVSDIVNTINNVYHNITAVNTDTLLNGSETSTNTSVKAGDTVTYKAGKNLFVQADGHNVTYSLTNNVNLTSDGSFTIGDASNPATYTAVTGGKLVVGGSASNVTIADSTVSNLKGNLAQTVNVGDKVEKTDGSRQLSAKAATAPTTSQAAPSNVGNIYNNAATVGDVLNAGWNLQNNGEAKDFVKSYDTVNFVNGVGTTAVVTTSKDGKTSDVTFNVNKASFSSTPSNTAAENDITVTEAGKIVAPSNATSAGDTFVTADVLTKVVNAAGFSLTTSANGGVKDDASTAAEQINAGDTINMIAGKNLVVKQEANGNITYATNENVSFSNVNTTTLSVGDTTKNDAPVVNFRAEAATPANVSSTAPTTALNVTAADGTPTQITGVASTLNKQTVATSPKGTGSTASSDLVDLANATNPNSAATVGDLQNMGWIVSAKDNSYSDDVRNANEVTFKGASSSVTVTGETNATTGVREISINTPFTSVSNDVTTVTQAKAEGSNSLALGNNATVAANAAPSSVAVGNDSVAGAVHTGNYVYGGSGSVAGTPNANTGVFSVGSAGNERQIQNVAAGRIAADSTDAINGSQLHAVARELDGKMGDMDKDLRAGVAASMAAAGLPQAFMPGKSLFAVGGGTYGGETGYAASLSSISDGGNWIVKGTASGNSRGKMGASAAVGYQW